MPPSDPSDQNWKRSHDEYLDRLIATRDPGYSSDMGLKRLATILVGVMLSRPGHPPACWTRGRSHSESDTTSTSLTGSSYTNGSGITTPYWWPCLYCATSRTPWAYYLASTTPRNCAPFWNGSRATRHLTSSPGWACPPSAPSPSATNPQARH